MDFGTWISKGLGYANKNGESFLRKKYIDVAAPAVANDTMRISLTKDSDVEFLARNTENLTAFLASETETVFVFEKCNPYLRKVLYQLMEFDYPSFTVVKNSDERLQVLKLSEAEKKQREVDIVAEGKILFEAAMGFRLVFLDLIAAKKPIIGHNCLFDFMFMMRWFDSPFKDGKMDTLTTFKEKFNDYFPVAFDTKYITTVGIMGGEHSDTSLGELYKSVIVPITDSNVVFAQGFEQYYSAGGQFHDAGWDAYCTGALFCHQLTHLPMEEMITKAGNKLFMMYSLYHMDMDPSQPNGFLKISGVLIHLGDFGSDTKNDAILKVFTDAGYALNSIEVLWIDGTSTFVTIDASELYEEIKLKVSLPTGWRLRSYEEYINPPVEVAVDRNDESLVSEEQPPLKKGRIDVAE